MPPENLPPKYVQQIHLTAEDTSVTEITLNVAIAESVEQRVYSVYRDTQLLRYYIYRYRTPPQPQLHLQSIPHTQHQSD